MASQHSDKLVLLYDGVCALCNGAVLFLIERDRHDRFRFAPLQSQLGRELVQKHGGNPEELSSLVLLEQVDTPRERAWFRSRAVVLALAHLGGMWRAAHLLRVFPAFLLDPMYRLVAALRYRLFGRYESCRLPAPGERDKFIAAD